MLFTDLVGFTARSNDMEPEALFSLLNRYFSAMAEPVLAEDGLLDKFIGDSLMAEFGVPRHRGDRLEALAAARAALAMCRNLDALNQDLNSEGLAPLQQGHWPSLWRSHRWEPWLEPSPGIHRDRRQRESGQSAGIPNPTPPWALDSDEPRTSRAAGGGRDR